MQGDVACFLGPSSADSWRRGCVTAVGALSGFLLALLLAACSGNGASSPPPDFPSADVPLAPGSLSAFKKTGVVWDVSVAVGSEDEQRAALTLLLERGFTIIGQSDSASSEVSYSLANPSYAIRLGYDTATDDRQITYRVVQRAASDVVKPR